MKKLFLLLTAIVTLAMSAMAQNRTYTGTVLSSADNEPLIGATVTPIGGGHATMTDVNGQFTLSVPASVKEVKVTYVGMTPKTVALKNGMKIFLDNAATVLDQIVVTGYGSTKKLGSVVGSVSVVNQETIENTPSTTFVDALQGQVPGLAINSNSGDPSANRQSIVLRGINSLTASNTPLFICDGAPISSSMFQTLNPSDIENVTVLKDAASVAIYGSRAANGVIVITTKRGKYGEGKSNVTIRASYGISQMVADNVEMMNSEQYIKFRDIIGSPVSQEVKDLVANYGITTNWRNEFFNSSAPVYSLDAAVSGGTDKLRYYIDLNHYDQEGIIEHAGIRRESLRFSIDAKANDWLQIGLNGNLGYKKYESNASSDGVYAGDGLYLSSPMIAARMALPFDSPYYYTFNDNGDIIYGEKAYRLHYSGFNTPAWSYANASNYKTAVTANINLYEQLTPIKGLTLRAQQSVEGFDYNNYVRSYPYESFYTPMGDKMGSNPVGGNINSGSASMLFQRYYQFTYTNTAEYKNTFGDHSFAILLGQEAIISRNHSFSGGSTGHTDKRMMRLNQGTTTTMGNLSESISEEVFNSYFANLNYDYANRYFLDASIRRDGSSIFAPDNRWGTFFAIGAAWNIKNESFLREITWLDQLKLHYSYGKTGNSGISSFLWQGTVGSAGLYAGSTATGISRPSNPDLTWESVYTHDLGINARIFDRLTINADWYMKTTKDMLMSIPYSLTTGVSSAYGNVCEMSNKGVEVELIGDIFKNKDWYVGARVNFAYNQNRIEKLFDGSDAYTIANTGLRYAVGHDAYEYYMVRYVGVDPKDGRQMWLDKNDNVTKEFPSDAYVMTGKSSFAPWTGGFGASARYKGISLSANFNFQAKKYMVNNDKYFYRNSDQGTSFNQCTDMLNVWTTPGQVTDIPRVGEELHLGDDTGWLENASFVRLKNLTVAYDFPKSLVNRWGLNGIQLHFTGRNLWTITDFSGYDPEPQSNMIQFQFPNTRQYEFGLEVSF